MFKASSSHFPLAAVLLLPVLAVTSMTAQGTSPPQTKLSCKAALVQTPDFCTSRVTHGVPKDPKIGIEAGKVACVDFAPALKEVFTTLSTISSPKDAGDAQVILTPRFVDAGVTTGLTAFSNSELTLFLEWTAQDADGKQFGSTRCKDLRSTTQGLFLPIRRTRSQSSALPCRMLPCNQRGRCRLRRSCVSTLLKCCSATARLATDGRRRPP